MAIAKKPSNITNIEDLKNDEALKAAKAAEMAKSSEPAQKEEPKFEMDMLEYILKGYSTKEINIKGVKVIIRTLTQEEAICILKKIADSGMASKAHADAIMTAYTAGMAMVTINGEPLAKRQEKDDLDTFIEERYKYVMTMGISFLDRINLEYSKLNKNVSEYLADPEEALKN